MDTKQSLNLYEFFSQLASNKTPLKPPAKFTSIKSMLKSYAARTPSFNKSKQFTEGKTRILNNTSKFYVDSASKQEKFSSLFTQKTRTLSNMILPEMMEDQDVIKILKSQKRTFGNIEAVKSNRSEPGIYFNHDIISFRPTSIALNSPKFVRTRHESRSGPLSPVIEHRINTSKGKTRTLQIKKSASKHKPRNFALI